MTIIDVTGAASYHGFLPVMVRNCIASLTGGSTGASNIATETPFPQPLATALFSFLYHLASYEAGGESLVSCGMMESLLKVTNHFLIYDLKVGFTNGPILLAELAAGVLVSLTSWLLRQLSS